ncbi:apolipoprotein N-acyltransferase [Pokkaliibacter sp. CJK22405]|uniref:apolipoprotein N-acyltransferase n=1 Tax=Pokkaliibacter sp. CJK22405 TaxID=3384615 RepID=UPI0039856720
MTQDAQRHWLDRLPTTKGKLPLLFALIAGAIYPLGFAPFGYWPLTLLSVSYFFVLMQTASSLRQALARGWLFGTGLFGVGTSWVWVSMYHYGGTGIVLSALLTALFCMAMALFFLLQSALHFYTRRTGRWALLSLPAVWIISEIIRTYLFTGFPWLLLGYSGMDTYWQGFAPVLGVYGVSAILAICAVALANIIPPIFRESDLRLKPSFLIALTLASGWILERIDWTTPTEQAPLRIMLAQGNVPQNAKWQPDSAAPTIDRYEAMTRKAWSEPSLVIWPETAVPALLNNAYAYLAPFADELAKRQSALITGIPTRVDKDGTSEYHNSLVVLGDGLGLYHKRHLVPFGEYVPLESMLRGLIQFFDLPMSAFSKGKLEQPPLSTMGHKIAASICYEVAYPELMRIGADQADILMTVSNDTWFGDSFARYQHLEMVRMRALETGRPMVRATNDGMTAFISPKGKIEAELKQFKAGVLVHEVQGYRGETPFGRWGSWPTWVIAILAALISLSRRKRHPMKN